MCFRIVLQIGLLLSLVALAICDHPYYEKIQAEPVEQKEPAHYKFGYEVNDPHTGDYHAQYEVADGKAVKVGSYKIFIFLQLNFSHKFL